MGRRLERHVDWDLAERILASGRIKKVTTPKTTKKPRAAATIRQNGRPPRALAFKDRSFKGPVRLNTSRNRRSQFARSA